MFSVTIREKSGQVYTFHFDKPEIMIGRVKGNDVILPKQNISKRHSLVRAQGDRFIIEDLGSTNGTYVNGHRIASPVEITSEDKVYLGDFVMQFFDLGEEVSDEGHQPAAQKQAQRNETDGTGASDLSEALTPDAGAVAVEPAERSEVVEVVPPVPMPQAQPAPLMEDDDTTAGLESMAAVARLMAERKNRALPTDPQPAVAADDPFAAIDGLDGRSTGRLDDLNDNFGRAHHGASLSSEIDFPTDGELPASVAGGAGGGSDSSDVDRSTSLPANQLGPSFALREPSHSGVDHAQALPETPLRPPAAPILQRIELGADHHEALAALYNAALDALHGLLPHDAALLDDTQWQAMEGQVVQFVDDVIADTDVPPVVDVAALKRDLIYELAGLGPLEALLDDKAVETIEVNGHDQMHVFRSGLREAVQSRFSGQAALVAVVERLVRATGLNVVDGAMHAKGALADGTSVRVLWPPLCPNGPVLLLRKPRNSAPSLADLVADGRVDQSTVDRLLEAVRDGRNVAVCGPRDSGKRTFVNALAMAIDASERIAVAEAGVRMSLPQPHVVRLDTSVRSHPEPVLRVALSMRPERLLLCSEDHTELSSLVIESCSGVPPWIGSFFALDSADLLRRAERAVSLAHAGVSEVVVRESVAATFDLVACLSCEGDRDWKFERLGQVAHSDGKLQVKDLPG